MFGGLQPIISNKTWYPPPVLAHEDGNKFFYCIYCSMIRTYVPHQVPIKWPVSGALQYIMLCAVVGATIFAFCLASMWTSVKTLITQAQDGRLNRTFQAFDIGCFEIFIEESIELLIFVGPIYSIFPDLGNSVIHMQFECADGHRNLDFNVCNVNFCQIYA